MVATITFLPFTLSGAITALKSLDFLGFGLPAGPASLGELLKQGKENITAPRLGLTRSFSIAVMRSPLVFIGEADRDLLSLPKLFIRPTKEEHSSHVPRKRDVQDKNC